MSAYFVYTNPISNLVALGYLFGISVLFHVIADIYIYFTLSKELRSTWLLVSGVFSIIVSILFLISGMFSIVVSIPILFAFWVMVAGVTKITAGIELKRVTGASSPLIIVSGVLSLLLGFLVTILLVGILIYQGCVNIYEFFTL